MVGRRRDGHWLLERRPQRGPRQRRRRGHHAQVLALAAKRCLHAKLETSLDCCCCCRCEAMTSQNGKVLLQNGKSIILTFKNKPYLNYLHLEQGLQTQMSSQDQILKKINSRAKQRQMYLLLVARKISVWNPWFTTCLFTYYLLTTFLRKIGFFFPNKKKAFKCHIQHEFDMFSKKNLRLPIFMKILYF